MMKKKMTVLSFLVLPNTFSALNYGEASAKQEILSSSNEDNAKTNNEIDSSNIDINGKHVLQQLVDEALKDLKKPIDFSNSFLMENDYLRFDYIENKFINVLNSQIKQKDKRLLIKLFNKSQDLLNNRKIEVEVIGKDDNEEVKKTIQVTPIKLVSQTEYINNLKKEIQITYANNIFAYNEKYNPPYQLEKIDYKLKLKFIELNADQLWVTDDIFFSIVHDNTYDRYIKFEKGKNIISVNIKFKYNNKMTKIDLTLLDIEDHPQLIIHKVADPFITNGLDLSNEPIFDDIDLDDINVERKIAEIIKARKQNYDEEDIIKIEVRGSLSHLNKLGYNIYFSHKKPQLRNRYYAVMNKPVMLKNIRKNPKRQTENFISMLKCFPFKKVYINTVNFNALNKYNGNDVSNLENTNSSLNSYLETSIKTVLEFGNLTIQDQKNMKFTAKRIAYKKISYIEISELEVEYEFSFTNSAGQTSLIKKSVWFEKNA